MLVRWRRDQVVVDCPGLELFKEDSFDFFFFGGFQARVEKKEHFWFSTADRPISEVTSGRLAVANGLMGFTEMLKRI